MWAFWSVARYQNSSNWSNHPHFPKVPLRGHFYRSTPGYHWQRFTWLWGTLGVISMKHIYYWSCHFFWEVHIFAVVEVLSYTTASPLICRHKLRGVDTCATFVRCMRLQESAKRCLLLSVWWVLTQISITLQTLCAAVSPISTILT